MSIKDSKEVSSTTIYLVRHGETEYNKDDRIQGQGVDAELNEWGEKQSQALARYFKDIEIDKIYSSSMQRAEQTAGIIADQKSMSVTSSAELVEMSYGTMEGNDKQDVLADIEKLHKNWDDGMVTLAPDQGESPVEVYRRANKEMMQLLEANKGRRLLFVLHGRLLRILLAVWLEMGLNRMSELTQDNASINLVKWDGDRFEAEFLNNKEHLHSLNGSQ